MSLEMVLTSLFSASLAVTVIAKGLPPIAYTLPDRLAVFTGPGPGFGGHVEQKDAMASLRPF